MDPHEALQEFMDHLPHASQFTGICDCVCEALKCSHVSPLPLFTEIADDVLDADKDYRCAIVMRPPCHINSSSSVPMTMASSTSVPPPVFSAVPVPISSCQTPCSSAWIPDQPLDLCHRNTNMPVDHHTHNIPAQAHLADVELPDGDITTSDAIPLHDDHLPSETTSPDFAALSVALHIPSSTVLNTDYFFEAYMT